MCVIHFNLIHTCCHDLAAFDSLTKEDLEQTVTSDHILPSSGCCVQAWMCVSHFNLIHTSCHQAAKQADSALRAPKREWEGATLRNGETLCNNLLPLRCAAVSDTQHAAAVASFMDGLGHAPHRQVTVTLDGTLQTVIVSLQQTPSCRHDLDRSIDTCIP